MHEYHCRPAELIQSLPMTYSRYCRLYQGLMLQQKEVDRLTESYLYSRTIHSTFLQKIAWNHWILSFPGRHLKITSAIDLSKYQDRGYVPIAEISDLIDKEWTGHLRNWHNVNRRDAEILLEILTKIQTMRCNEDGQEIDMLQPAIGTYICEVAFSTDAWPPRKINVTLNLPVI